MTTSTEQIGCLVANADPCTMGIAGRPAVDPAGPAVALNINGIPADAASIQKLITDPANAYPFSRRLYYNSIAGFGTTTSLNNHEFELAKSFTNDNFMAGMIASNGLVTLPLQSGHTKRVYCVDFHEELSTANGGCGATTANNACADNAALGLPTF